MTPGARIQAAIDILDGFSSSKLPLDRFFDQWSRSHRYAGSKDRTAIKDLVYAVCRRRGEYTWLTQGETPRQLVIAALIVGQDLPLEEVQALFDGQGYGPQPLSNDETQLCSSILRSLPPDVELNCPSWLIDEISLPPGVDKTKELRTSATRAPVDLRVNTLKCTQDRAFDLLSDSKNPPERCANSEIGLRIKAGVDSQPSINLRGHDAYKQGLVEIQDEGSQIAALLVDARPGHQILDFCAGAGGKSLALAAAMENRGQIYAHDVDVARLKRLSPRLERARARNVQLWPAPADPHQSAAAFAEWYEKFDRVLVDAPCSGSGTWRRNPDAKWRLTPDQLERYAEGQTRLLAAAAPLVKPGGRLVYVTCSLLKRENEGRIEEFLGRGRGFKLVEINQIWRDVPALESQSELPKKLQNPYTTLALSPFSAETDGTFIAVLDRER
jgi:16S rRNA (cytosine967-C5)-methyltransferase